LIVGACSDIKGFVFENIGSRYMTFDIKGINNSIAPGMYAVFAMVLGLFILSLVIIVFGKSKMRSYGTWDCGFKALTPRMQYTGTGFTKPMRIIFRWLFRPERELVIQEQTGKHHIKKARYNVKTISIFDEFLYRPFVMALLNFSRRFRFTVQMGSVHVYLLYIFAALVCMFVYFAMSN
jgi:hydrogenase-4 component B